MGHFIGKREQKMMRPLAARFLTDAKRSFTEVSCVNSVSTSNFFQRDRDPEVRVTRVRAEPRKQGAPIGLSTHPKCASLSRLHWDF